MTRSAVGPSGTSSGTVQHSPWLFRYAVGLAVCILGIIVLGASLTSEIQPIPGSETPVVTASTPAQVWLEQFHSSAALVAAGLTLGLCVWLQLSGRRAWLRWLGWAALAVVAGEGWSGMQNTLQSLPRAAGFLHASLAQVLLATVVAIAAGTAVRSQPDDLADDSGRPSLRSLTTVAPVLVFLQVLLGAAFRHGAMGVLSHIFNAMIVMIVILVTYMFVTRQFPSHPGLRPPTVALAIVTGVQVALGFATLILLLMNSTKPLPLFVLSVGHVTTGAANLAASVVLAIQIRRHLRPPR